MIGNGHVRFGEGPLEKGLLPGTSPAAYSTCAEQTGAYLCLRQKGFERKPLGQRAYLTAKANGNHRLLVKRELSEGVYGTVPQDPRDMAKALLLEAQSPARQRYLLRSPRPTRSDRLTLCSQLGSGPFGRSAVTHPVTQGDECAAYVTLARPRSVKLGITYGARALG
jgi:hypothetical protein